MDTRKSYNQVRELVERGDLEIDLVLASSRSCSTVICQALSTIADYDTYFHEPLRISSKATLNDDVTIDGQSARSYDPYQHMLSQFQELSKAEAPVRFLVKEMVAGEEYEECPDFPEQYRNALDELRELARNSLLVTRHPIERLKSLNHTPESDCVNSDIRLIFRENSEISDLKQRNGITFIDVSETSQLYEDPIQFFDNLVSDIGRQRLPNQSIESFDNSVIISDLVILDSWAKESFEKHKGFSLKPSEDIGHIMCVESEELAEAIESYYTDIHLN
ncbi:MAG: hypothetical protein ACRBCK_05240 [Alphaproteobacteria bacterium]